MITGYQLTASLVAGLRSLSGITCAIARAHVWGPRHMIRIGDATGVQPNYPTAPHTTPHTK